MVKLGNSPRFPDLYHVDPMTAVFEDEEPRPKSPVRPPPPAAAPQAATVTAPAPPRQPAGS
jgi:hypothetical protein